ncbi:MAG TPA: flagellar basal body-associated FliL family protein [Spirochaetota bacterium]|nr:flagellar basal body-associated FliL family protein [Spirochaetota bacterium]HOM38700.1 flagellar basal body-associated FliL family protein [Spirochaetota bacterium]HPQ49784.1 flagellar basal body-associated FliL family protein [Spirochaetota bacterium]
MAEEKEEIEEKEDTETYTQEEGPKLSSKLVKMLMLVAAFIVGIIIMIIVSNIVYNIKTKGETAVQEKIWAPGVTPKKEPFQTLHLDPFRLNLNDPTGANPVFIQLEIALAYESNNIKLQTELLNRKFEIRDTIITLISSKTYEDLNTPDKIQSFKKEIQRQVNSLLINGLIEDVYIIDFNAIPKS